MVVHELIERSELQELMTSNPGKLLVVDFFATWCGPCKAIGPYVPQFAEEFPDAIFVKVDVDDADDLSEDYEVTAMPTFIFFKGEEKLAEYTGTDPERIREIIREHL